MDKLKAELDNLLKRLENAEVFQENLKSLISVYPFNEFEFITSNLLAAGRLTLAEYDEIRQNYIDRNPYLHLFGKAPTALEKSVIDEVFIKTFPSLLKPSKELDSSYEKRKYDLFLKPNIKIELKTSRAVNAESDLPLQEKALSSDSQRTFDMNFQQLKPDFCDVFILTIIWRNKIEFIIINSKEIKERHYSKGQHAGRGESDEGQLHIKQNNIEYFRKKFSSSLEKIEEKIKAAYKRKKR